jgi:hypothetical protein
MPQATWQKSSYCAQGNSCIHVRRTTETIHLTESSDPTGAILTATPAAFGALLAVLKTETPHDTDAGIEIAFGEGDDGDTPVFLRETSAPDNVVTTNRRKWEAFVLGVQAGDFDHFVDDARHAA